MARRVSSKNELIKCEYCGEMYAASYKHCPFCNEDGTGRWDVPDEEDYDEVPQGGGKRLASGGVKRTGGGRRQGPSVRRVISMVVSLALIIAAAGIVISIVRSLVGGKDPAVADSPSPAPTQAQSAAPSAVPTPTQPAVDPDPVPSAGVGVADPQPSVQPIPSVDLVAPTGFKLNRDDFTLDHAGETFQMKVTYTPADARGDVTWKSSNPNVASVSWNGVVTAISKGTVTLTASVAGVGDKTCIVRCNFKDAATTTTTVTATQAPAASSAPASSSSGLKLNRDDFTLSRAGETWRLTVSGTSSAVTWTSSKPEVATVAADGTVTAVSKGTCNVTATVDGKTLKCIVRCNF